MASSTVSKLPASTQSELLKRWQAGDPLHELQKLAPGVSRSALHRFLRRKKKNERLEIAEAKLDAIRQILREAR